MADGKAMSMVKPLSAPKVYRSVRMVPRAGGSVEKNEPEHCYMPFTSSHPAEKACAALAALDSNPALAAESLS
jgi:hypothetical protein